MTPLRVRLNPCNTHNVKVTRMKRDKDAYYEKKKYIYTAEVTLICVLWKREHVKLHPCMKKYGRWILFKCHAQINLRKIKPQKGIKELNQSNTSHQTQPQLQIKGNKN